MRKIDAHCHKSFGLTGTLLAVLLFVPILAFAQTLQITPALIDSSEPVEQALNENKGHAITTLEGAGKALSITYSASEPIEVFMVPLETENAYVPTDYVRFTLPATTQGTVLIDLTMSP